MDLHPDVMKLIEYWGYGGLGGLIGTAAKTRRLQLPRVVVEREADGQVKKLIDPGFLVSVLVGGFLAAWIDGRPFTALAYGVLAGWVGPSILGQAVDQMLKRFGLDVDGPSVRIEPLATEKRS